MAFFDPYFATRRRVQLALAIAGMTAGGVFGLVLTALGKILAGAPPATPGNYLWNADVFGVLGAVVGPMVTWSALRRVPLWRTIAEPLAGAVIGAAIGLAAGSAALFLALPAVGLALGFTRLSRAYPERATPFWALPRRGRRAAE